MAGGATRRSVIRSMITASASVLPAAPLITTAACGTRAAQRLTAASPSDVSILRSAIAAKTKMIALYTAVIAAHPPLAPHLRPLLRDNNAHLHELERRLVHPGAPHPSRHGASPPPSPPPVIPARRATAIAALRSAESAAAALHTQQLQTVAPSFAQLLASIAACEATHAALLARAGRTP